MPLISVLLPVYNAILDLPRAIQSIRAQTLTDFEVIAIDDGSTDGSGNMLDEYAQSDTRIRVIHQPNAGALGKVLNRAAEFASGKYLARQDADDASAPTRFELQVQYLENNPHIGLCGTWVWYIENVLGPLFSYEIPDKHQLILDYLLKGLNPFTHGSVMMQADLFRNTGGYRGSLSEDMDLWLRLSEKTKLGMVTQVQYYYWRSIGGINTGSTMRQKALNQLIVNLHFERIKAGFEITNWTSEYDLIINSNPNESKPEERQAAIHYARALALLRIGRWKDYRTELQKSALAQGPYAQKAKRNLTLFWASPLVAWIYRILEMNEPFYHTRRFKPGTPLPEFLIPHQKIG
jgi:glycosyltransferase involved in cell wall biosynthesis